MRQIAVHYVASEKHLGEKEKAMRYDPNTLQATETPDELLVCKHVSAGHKKHEYTTGYSWPMVKNQF